MGDPRYVSAGGGPIVGKGVRFPLLRRHARRLPRWLWPRLPDAPCASKVGRSSCLLPPSLCRRGGPSGDAIGEPRGRGDGPARRGKGSALLPVWEDQLVGGRPHTEFA